MVPDPLEPYVHRDLVVNFARRRATLGGQSLDLVSLEYRLLEELAVNTGRVLTCERVLERVWDQRGGGDLGPMRASVSKLRSQLGDDADHHTYVFTQSAGEATGDAGGGDTDGRPGNP